MTARDLQNSLLDLLMTEHMRVEETYVRLDNEPCESNDRTPETFREMEFREETIQHLMREELELQKLATFLPARTAMGALYQLNLIYERLDALMGKLPKEKPGIRPEAEEEHDIVRLLDSAISFFEDMSGVSGNSCWRGNRYIKENQPHRRALAALEETERKGKAGKRAAA